MDSHIASIINLLDHMKSSTGHERSLSDASTIVSPGGLPDINELSPSNDGEPTNTYPIPTAGEDHTNQNTYSNFPTGHVMRMIGQYNADVSTIQASIIDNSATTKRKPKTPPNRAAIISRDRAAKNDRVFVAPSSGAKRSARLETPNHKPILAAGRGSRSRREKMQKEAAEKKARKEADIKAWVETQKKVKEEEDTKHTKAKEEKRKKLAKLAIVELLKALPASAYKDLPDNFPHLPKYLKTKTLAMIHVKYGLHRDSKGQPSLVGRVIDYIVDPVIGRFIGEPGEDEFEESEEDSREHMEWPCRMLRKTKSVIREQPLEDPFL